MAFPDQAPPEASGVGASGPSVRRLHHLSFEVVGFPDVSPIFQTRREAERWLAKKIESLPERLRPRVRSCRCCGTDFRSDGPHNRLCNACRRLDAGAVPVKPAIPSAYHRHPR